MFQNILSFVISGISIFFATQKIQHGFVCGTKCKMFFSLKNLPLLL